MAWSECAKCQFAWDWGMGGPGNCPRCERRSAIAEVRHAIALVGPYNEAKALTLINQALQKLLDLAIANDPLR